MVPTIAVRVRLVAALMYAIDEMHIGDDRAEERLRDWINLENQESQKHWTRHKFIQGPVLVGESILFKADVASVVVEKDLREHVFLKAFGAIRDLNRELVSYGIDASILPPVVQWDRRTQYRIASIQKISSDEIADQGQLVEQLASDFLNIRNSLPPIDHVCAEKDEDEDSVQQKIAVEVEKLASQGFLSSQENGEALALSLIHI